MKVVPLYPDPFKLKIQLEHTDIYRVVLVPADSNMLQFHLVCQEAMGWMMEHLFSFIDKKGRNQSLNVGLPEIEEAFSFSAAPKEEKADRVKLQDFYKITDGQYFWYWYDFGDDWWHQITFQKPTKKEIELFKGIPICLEGQKTCPPENIGGVPGYEHFLRIILKNIQPDKEDLLDLYQIEDESMYPDEFDLELTNDVLTEIAQSEFWNMTADEFMD